MHLVNFSEATNTDRPCLPSEMSRVLKGRDAILPLYVCVTHIMHLDM